MLTLSRLQQANNIRQHVLNQGFNVSTDNKQDNSPKTQSPVATHIPVKNVKIHRAKSAPDEHYSPRDQIYVRKVTGFFQRLRRKMNFFFLGVFALLPWLQYNDKQAILFDLPNQEFNIFSLTLWPQDLLLLAWFFIILFLNPIKIQHGLRCRLYFCCRVNRGRWLTNNIINITI